jgi:ribose transport system substrate-binding protein
VKQKFNCQYDAYVSMEEPDAGAVNTARMGGYRNGFSSVCGPVKNLKTENAFRIDQARTTFTDVLTTLPGAHKIIVAGINDDAIEGALAAAKTAGRTNDLYVSGQGADPSAWCAIKSNSQWVGDTAYFPERYGEIGVPYLLQAIKGESIPKKLLVPHQILSAVNIDDTYHPSC